MARFKTICVPLGTHSSPDGDVCATPARVRQWAEKFTRMKRAGIRIPIAWGHQPNAIPIEDEAAFQLSISKFNAGYVDALYADPDTGGLALEGDAPGVEVDKAGNLVHWVRLPDGRQVKGAIGEVSAAVNDWRDGKGRLWPDAVMHVALTPLPVCGGQKGLQRLAAPRQTQQSGKRPVFLSTLTQAHWARRTTFPTPTPAELRSAEYRLWAHIAQKRGDWRQAWAYREAAKRIGELSRGDS